MRLKDKVILVTASTRGIGLAIVQKCFPYTTGQILTVSGGFGLAAPVYGDTVTRGAKR